MTEMTVDIFTPNGQKVGRFKNPTIDLLTADHYEITGIFCEADGSVVDRVEFNPQVLPYEADISQAPGLPHKRLVNVYVQRGRQPVQMIGVGAGT